MQKDWSSHLKSNPIFETVGNAATKIGVEAYAVGGYVRDLILQRPSKDIDFVCVGKGITLAKEVADQLAGSHLSVYENFGTASIHHNAMAYEFVGARKESYRRASRNPIVEDGTLEEDQNRRDFTINAMALALQGVNYGQLVDPFDGIGDLKRRLIRTSQSPDTTFLDDPLRMMRAIRLATQLNFDIAPDTFEGITKNAERIKIVSFERIIDELNKIILSETPSYGFKLLFHAGLLQFIFPEMVRLQGVEKIDGKGHKDNFYHTLQVVDNISKATDNLWLRWAAIMHDIAKPATQKFDRKANWTFHGHEDVGARWVPRIFKRMKLPLDSRMRYVQKLVRLHMRPIALVSEKATDSAIRRMLFEVGTDIKDLITLCKADITSKNPHKVSRYLQNFKKVEEKIREVEERDRIMNFQPPITGEQIIETLKIEPSKRVGDIKNAIKEAILEGKIENNPEEAFQLMLKLGKQQGLPKS